MAVVLIAGAAALVLARAGLVLQPVGDIALIELYTRDALAGTLLEGPYSHFPWHHPGPLYFYVLAPIYALGGRTPAALNAGAALLSLSSLGVIVWLLARRHSLWSAAIVLGCVVLYALRVDGLLVSVWNPHVVVLPTAVFLLAASGLAAGDGALLPLVVAAGSFVVQSDVAVVPVVAAVSLVALIAFAKQSRFSNRQLAAAVAIALLAWSVPLVEQVTATAAAGNAAALVRFFTTPRAAQPLAASFGAWSVAMATPLRGLFHPILPPSGNGVADATSFDLAAASALLIAAAAVTALAVRRGWHEAAWLGAIGTLAAVVSFASITRIDGPITDHQVFWMSIVGVVEVAAVLVVLAGPAFEARGSSGAAAVVLVTMLSVASIAALIQMNRARQGSAPATEFLPSIVNFGESIRRYVEVSGARRPLVRIDQQQWGIAAGILLQLHRLGVPFYVEDSWASMFPKRYRETGTEDVELTIVATGTDRQLAERAGDSLVDISTHVEVHGRRIR